MKYLKTYKLFEDIDSILIIHYQEDWEKLKEGITYLSCNNNELTSLPDLPSALEFLYCYDNKLTTLPELPSTLKCLTCENNPLTSLIPEKFFKDQPKSWLKEYINSNIIHWIEEDPSCFSWLEKYLNLENKEKYKHLSNQFGFFDLSGKS